MNDNRRTQMKWLLALTGLSLVPVYILIGWQSSGHGPDTVSDWFWLVEAGAWGLRALVEIWALIYLFQTVTRERNKLLIVFETALISLIALTVGLVIIANGNVESIASLPDWLFWLWSFAVAAFAPLMMGSVGYAFKVHEAETGTQIDIAELQADLEAAELMAQGRVEEIAEMQSVIDSGNADTRQMQKQITHLESSLARAEKTIADLNRQAGVVTEWQRLSATTRAKIIALCANGDKPAMKDLAEDLGVAISTVQRGYKQADEEVKR